MYVPTTALRQLSFALHSHMVKRFRNAFPHKGIYLRKATSGRLLVACDRSKLQPDSW